MSLVRKDVSGSSSYFWKATKKNRVVPNFLTGNNRFFTYYQTEIC